MQDKISIMIHGGAGAIQNLDDYRSSVIKVVKKGQSMLLKGRSAMDVVEHCTSLLENDPLFNAGKGSVLNEKGKVEMDAAIMDGSNLGAGAVAGVVGVKNPVRLARRVLDKSQHVMLVGKGAVEFGKMHKIEMRPDEYFIVKKRLDQWRDARKKELVVLDHSSVLATASEKKLGTVGVVARDRNKNLAAATSTGGIVNKKYGRVGDSPIIGAGTYADNQTCAVSATGFGEQFMRSVLAKHVSDLILYKKLRAKAAANEAIKYFVENVNGLGGIIVIDKLGNCGSAYSTPGMIQAWVKDDGDVILGF